MKRYTQWMSLLALVFLGMLFINKRFFHLGRNQSEIPPLEEYTHGNQITARDILQESVPEEIFSQIGQPNLSYEEAVSLLISRSMWREIAYFISRVEDAKLRKLLMVKAFSDAWNEGPDTMCLFASEFPKGMELEVGPAIAKALESQPWDNAIELAKVDLTELQKAGGSVNAAITGLMMPLIKNDFTQFKKLIIGVRADEIPKKCLDNVAFFVPMLDIDDADRINLLGSIGDIPEEHRERITDFAFNGLIRKNKDDSQVLETIANIESESFANTLYERSARERQEEPGRAFKFVDLISSESARLNLYADLIGASAKRDQDRRNALIESISDARDREKMMTWAQELGDGS